MVLNIQSVITKLFEYFYSNNTFEIQCTLDGIGDWIEDKISKVGQDFK